MASSIGGGSRRQAASTSPSVAPGSSRMLNTLSAPVLSAISAFASMIGRYCLGLGVQVRGLKLLRRLIVEAEPEVRRRRRASFCPSAGRQDLAQLPVELGRELLHLGTLGGEAGHRCRAARKEVGAGQHGLDECLHRIEFRASTRSWSPNGLGSFGPH